MSLAGLLVLVGVTTTLAFSQPASAAPGSIVLGSADGYSLLAGSTVTSTGATAVGDDLGVSPGSAVTGFPPGVVGGTVHAADAGAAQAQADAATAYTDAASRPPSAVVTADLGGTSLGPGVYSSATSLSLTGTVTLTSGGDPDAVFLFQAGSTLTTAPASAVVLNPDVNPCNVFWQVGSSATLGTGSSFVGTVLAHTAITAQRGTRVSGRLLASTAAVTLDTVQVTAPVCSAVLPSPSATPSATATPTASLTASPMPTSSASAVPSVSASVSVSAVPVATSTTTPSAGPVASSTATPSTGPPVTTARPTLGTPVVSPSPSGSGNGHALPSATTGAGTVVARSTSVTALPRTGQPISEDLTLGLALLSTGGAFCLASSLRKR